MPDMNMRTFEELKRHQLVTEFNIQSQSELEDYQVKLDDVSNPTQAQDNLVVGVNGESLSHWNESVDFDTWVKMNIGVSGKRGLLIHGNGGLNGGSSGDGTFIQHHGDATSDYLDALVQDVPLVYEGYHKMTSASTQIYMGVSNNANMITPDSALYRILFSHENTQYSNAANDSTRTWESSTLDLDVDTHYRTKIIAESPSSVKFYIDEDYIDTITINIPNEQLGLSVDTNLGTFSQEWAFIRKYTATEPTYTIGAPKNISTALKSFGRAG